MAIKPALLLKYLYVIFITLSLSFPCFSQQKSTYNLLWKISGNGLKKPSYLFGTMHVKDKRVFNFSDSVMLSLQSCTRFALEVQPDTTMKRMFALLQNQDSLRYIDKLLDKEQYQKLSKKFQDKNGYPMGKIDPMMLESLMSEDDNKPDNKITFIDAYLYGIARTLKKTVLGLEDASTQVDEYYGSKDAIKQRLLDLLDDDITAGKDEATEEMINIYSRGNLDEIYNYAQGNGMLDSVLTERNKVMAASIIKYMTDESLFTAVGAAHLPGAQGVIALLKKAGYVLTPVQSSFTGVANTFHIDYLKMEWSSFRDDNMGYSIDFPGTPIKYALSGLTTMIYPDMANDIYYGIYSIPKGTPDEPASWKPVIEKAYDFINKNKKYSIISRKDFQYNKQPITELLLKYNGQFMRMRLFLANNLLYFFYVGSRLNHLSQPYVDKFLNSFATFPKPQKAPVSWITFNSPAGAFKIKLPAQPQSVIKEVPSKIQSEQVTFVMNMYVSTDTLNSKTYLIRYNDYPRGTFIGDKQALFNSLVKDFNNRGQVVSAPIKILKNGYEGREMKIILNGGYHTDIQLFVRGNRVYLLFKEIFAADVKDDQKDVFFDSFEFLPYEEPDYYTYKPDGENFKITMPAKPKIVIDSAKTTSSYINHSVNCFSTNPKSGGFYDFEYSKISKYYRIENADSLYKKMIPRLTTYQDSLLKIDTILVGGIKGREFLTVRKATGEKKRNRIMIDGDNFFYLSARLDSAELFNKVTNIFYDSLTLNQPSNKIDLASSKAGLIFNDLGSSDTVIYKNALGALSFYVFKPNELSFIYTALSKNYPDDSLYSGAAHRLLRDLIATNNDSTINVLSKLYSKSKGRDDFKASILNTVPFINKKAGYDVYLNLLITDPPLKAKESYQIFNALTDSVEFAAINFERVLPFIRQENYRYNILRIANNIASEKNEAYTQTIKKNYQSITAFANTDLDKYLVIKDSADNKWGVYVYNYLLIAGKVKNRDFADQFTKKYLEKAPLGNYVEDAIIARINNDLPNNNLLISKYLDSIGSRYDLMEAYFRQNQLDKVPLKYRTQQAFAKLCLYQYISTDEDGEDGSPSKLSLLGSIEKNKEVYYVFKYVLAEGEEKSELIGIAGPYTIGSTKLNFERYHAYTEYKTLKPNWRLQAEKMIKPLKDAYKK